MFVVLEYNRNGEWMITMETGRPNKTMRWIRWVARIWSVPIILYTLIMLIGYGWSWVTTGVADPYAVEDVSFFEMLPLIFMIIGVVGLGIAWRWEGSGGLITIISGLITVLLLTIQGSLSGDFARLMIPSLMSLVVAIPGVLFLVCYYKAKEGG